MPPQKGEGEETGKDIELFLAPKRINSEAISDHEHSDCLENTSYKLGEESTRFLRVLSMYTTHNVM